jgi:hypothetical protein
MQGEITILPEFVKTFDTMIKKELVETTVVYCDYCGEKITDYSHTSVNDTEGITLDFHSWGREKCFVKYKKSIKKLN